MYKELERLEEAVTHLKKFLVLKPEISDAHGNLGIILRTLGRPDEALECFNSAIALKPNFADFYINRSIALSELEQFDAAIADLDLGGSDAYQPTINAILAALRAIGAIEN